MNRLNARQIAILVAIAVFAVMGAVLATRAESTPAHRTAAIAANNSTEAKIARAMAAGPADVASSAKIVDKDAQGHTVVLREGSNSFTCLPGNPNVIGDPAMCADAASMQWFADFAAHKPKPTNTVPGITYMLAGATQRSDSDPHDHSSPGMFVPPHWMIMWPFDAKATGLPTTHRDTGAYIMWSGTPYAHMHIMGHPEGNQ
jgi:hypothetical protein